MQFNWVYIKTVRNKFEWFKILHLLYLKKSISKEYVFENNSILFLIWVKKKGINDLNICIYIVK